MRTNYALVRSQNVFDRAFSNDGLAFISDEQAAGLRNAMLRKDDLLLNITGDGATFGRACLVTESVLPACVNQHVSIIRLDKTQANPGYVLSYLTHPLIKAYIEGFNAGGSRRAITKGHIESFVVPLPPLAEQERMAGILDALDERISLLRETSATLEAIAQALFKSWFIDFDPVRAKQNGRVPDGMDEAIAALFPDAFEESELGLMPKGWRPCPVYELASYINGAAYKVFDPNAERRGLPIIKIAELKAGVTSQTAYSDVEMPEKYRIRLGDILFSWSGNPDTSIDTFVWHHSEAWLNQHIFRVVPHRAIERPFVLQTLRYLRPTFAELARNKQTTGLGHVTVADMKRLRVVRPDETVISLFSEIAGPIYEKAFENQTQLISLAAIRDTLLPRLISGQLRLPEAEALAA